MMKQKGFTLIELLVVISIIAILAALAIFGLGNVFENSRNARRRSDLKQYQVSLENFANAHNSLYPSRTTDAGVVVVTTLCTTDLQLGDCPNDPTEEAADGTWLDYRYESDGAGNGCSVTPCILAPNYVMWARLEPESPTNYWVVCSNGESGERSTIPSATNGVCPI